MNEFDGIDTSQITSILRTTHHGSLCIQSQQKVVLLSKELRTDFRRRPAARFLFWHPQGLCQFRTFYRMKESPIYSFLKWCNCLEKASSEQQKDVYLHLHGPFLPMLYNAPKAYGCPLCQSIEICFPAEQHCHLSCGCSVL